MGQAGKDRASSGIATWGVHAFQCQVYQLWYGQLKLQTTKSSWSAACHFNKCLLPQINLHAWLLDYPRRQSSFNGELKNIMIKSLPFYHLAKKEKENDFIYSN
jgi:hypothetical protein